MNKSTFDKANEALKAEGFQILESKYHRESFGNWFITIQSAPKLRVVWDGKDEVLQISKETDELFNGSKLWKNTWSVEKPNEADYKKCISQLTKLAV